MQIKNSFLLPKAVNPIYKQTLVDTQPTSWSTLSQHLIDSRSILYSFECWMTHVLIHTQWHVYKN